MRTILALVSFAICPLAAIAQDKTTSPTTVTLADYSSRLGEFARQAVESANSSPIDSESLIKALNQSGVFAENPFVKSQTLNVIRELASLGLGYQKALDLYDSVKPSDKPMLSPLSGDEWVIQERERLDKNYLAKRASTQKYVAQCISILERQAQAANSQRFSMLGSDPFLAALEKDQARLASSKKEENIETITIAFEVDQMTQRGFFATVRKSISWSHSGADLPENYQTIFITGFPREIANGDLVAAKVAREGFVEIDGNKWRRYRVLAEFKDRRYY